MTIKDSILVKTLMVVLIVGVLFTAFPTDVLSHDKWTNIRWVTYTKTTWHTSTTWTNTPVSGSHSVTSTSETKTVKALYSDPVEHKHWWERLGELIGKLKP